jgi:hypothetical protein
MIENFLIISYSFFWSVVIFMEQPYFLCEILQTFCRKFNGLNVLRYSYPLGI